MNSVLLSTAMSFSERMAYGLQVFVVGLGTVFAVLVILWLSLLLFKLFAYDLPQKKSKKALAERAANITKEHNTSASVEAEPVIEAEQTSDDTELIAVITAAIAAYNAGNGSSLPFRVVSYKRVSGANGWNGNK